MKYKQRMDGEGFELPLKQIYKLACCDCGLVHQVVFAVEDGKLGMAAKRDNRATGQRRRYIKSVISL
jgi:hypothetical protein